MAYTDREIQEEVKTFGTQEQVEDYLPSANVGELVFITDFFNKTNGNYKIHIENGVVSLIDALSSDGMSILSSTSTSTAQHAHIQKTDIIFPSDYVIKEGDLILLANGRVYSVTSVSISAVIASYTNISLKGEQGIQGEKGDKGDKGDSGQDGLTTAIKVNSSTTRTQSGGVVDLSSDFASKAGTGANTFSGNQNITGTITASGNITGNYLIGTWLQTTANIHLGSAPPSYAVLSNGWVYSRTLAETKADLGVKEHLYQHTMRIYYGAYDTGVIMIILNDSPTPLTPESIATKYYKMRPILYGCIYEDGEVCVVSNGIIYSYVEDDGGLNIILTCYNWGDKDLYLDSITDNVYQLF